MENLSSEKLLQCSGGGLINFATTLLISLISLTRLIKSFKKVRR